MEVFQVESKEDFFKLCIQFIKFCVVGVSNTLIALVIYYVFVIIDKDLYIVGNSVGFVVSVLNAYYWNNKYVFKKNEKSTIKTLTRTFTAYGSTFLLSTVFLYLMVHKMGISEMIAPLINLIITIPLNFIINKLWTFK